MLVERREAEFRRRAGVTPAEYVAADGADPDLRALASVLIADRRTVDDAGDELMAAIRARAGLRKRPPG